MFNFDDTITYKQATTSHLGRAPYWKRSPHKQLPHRTVHWLDQTLLTLFRKPTKGFRFRMLPRYFVCLFSAWAYFAWRFAVLITRQSTTKHNRKTSIVLRQSDFAGAAHLSYSVWQVFLVESVIRQTWWFCLLNSQIWLSWRSRETWLSKLHFCKQFQTWLRVILESGM